MSADIYPLMIYRLTPTKFQRFGLSCVVIINCGDVLFQFFSDINRHPGHISRKCFFLFCIVDGFVFVAIVIHILVDMSGRILVRKFSYLCSYFGSYIGS